MAPKFLFPQPSETSAPFDYERVFREILVKFSKTESPIYESELSQKETTMVESLTRMIRHFAGSRSMDYYEWLLVRRARHFPCDDYDFTYCTEDSPKKLLQNFVDRMYAIFGEATLASSDKINPFLSERKVYHKAVVECLLLAINLLQGIENHTFRNDISCILSIGREDKECEDDITFDKILNELLEMFKFNNIPYLLSEACETTDVFGVECELELEFNLQLTIHEKKSLI